MKFCSCALQTLSTYCIENTSVRAVAHTTPNAPTTPKTLAVLLVVRGGCCLRGTNVSVVEI